MKSLTIRHPFVFAICFCGKTIENRDWDDRLAELMGLPGLIGQQIAIHGGSAPKRGRNQGWRELLAGIEAIHHCLNGDLPDAAAEYLARKCQGGPLLAEHFILPGIVAVATISGARRDSESVWAMPGQLHIELTEVRPLSQAVSCPGAQGFWSVTPEIAEIAERRAAPTPASEFAGTTGAEWLQ